MTGRPSPLRVAVVALAALAGLFAMHGLTHHGEHLPSHDAAAHTVAAHSMAGDLMAVATDAAAPTTTPVSIEPEAGAMAMCLSILLTGLLAWTAVRRPTTRAAAPAPTLPRDRGPVAPRVPSPRLASTLVALGLPLLRSPAAPVAACSRTP